MPINKVPGESASATVESAEYQGPASTLYFLALIVQGPEGQLSSIKYASSVKSVNFLAAGSWTVMSIGLTLPMSASGASISPGSADGVIVVRQSATGPTFYSQIWSGAYNFVYPAVGIRGISSAFALKVHGVDVSFRR